MILSAVRPEREHYSNDLLRGCMLVLLSIAVSIDALAVGLSLGVLGIAVWYPALIIGVVTSLLSVLGLRLGNQFGRDSSKPVEIVGGLVLIGIGLRILVQHLIG